MVLLVGQWGLFQGRKVGNMSSLFSVISGKSNPLEIFTSYELNTDKDFTNVMFGDNETDDFNLNFDGGKLRLMRGNKELKSWDGVAGRKGYQASEYQNLKDIGPLPEGEYDVLQKNYQEMDILNALLGEVGRGTFPGGITSWGGKRIVLVPDSKNKMYERGDFTIHGGAYPDSRGCIDLTNQNEDFMRTFRSLGKNLRLKVQYLSNEEDDIQ